MDELKKEENNRIKLEFIKMKIQQMAEEPQTFEEMQNFFKTITYEKVKEYILRKIQVEKILIQSQKDDIDKRVQELEDFKKEI